MTRNRILALILALLGALIVFGIGVAVLLGLTSLAFGIQKGNAQSPGFVLPPHQRGLTLRQRWLIWIYRDSGCTR